MKAYDTIFGTISLPERTEIEILDVKKRRRQWERWKQRGHNKKKLFRLYAFEQKGLCALCNDFCRFPQKGESECRADRLGGQKVATFDHIKPLGAGGDNALSNLRMVCFECNREENDVFLTVRSIVSEVFSQEKD